MQHLKYRYLFIIGFVGLLSLFAVQSGNAQGQETCPQTGDWVKVDDINAQSFFYTAPDGYVIVETCYKAGTSVKYQTIDPPQSSVTVETTVPNPNDNAFLDISHASFRIAEEPKEEQSSASVEIGECDFELENGSFINVKLTITNAILTINDKQYSESQTLQLPPGEYIWSWVGAERYSGSGGGTIELKSCEPGKSDVSIDLGACMVLDGQAQRTLNIMLNNAVFTINGKEYTESTEIQLTPGDYPWSWQAISQEYEGFGEGVLSFEATCTTQTRDPKPDVAAGGMGPSLANSLAPILAGVAGLGIASIFVIKGKKEN